MPDASFRLTRLARQDLLQIGRTTEREWGRKQRNSYLRKLDAAFARLARHPELGRDEEEVRSGYRSYPQGRHLIFYRQIDGSIEIVRVLHQSMDHRLRL